MTPYEPDEATIAKEAAEIRKGWTEWDYRRRSGVLAKTHDFNLPSWERWECPEISLAEVPDGIRRAVGAETI